MQTGKHKHVQACAHNLHRSVINSSFCGTNSFQYFPLLTYTAIMYCWCTIGFQDCNEAFALHRFTFHRLRCNFALVQTWNHIYMHYALCSVHNGAQNIVSISLWTGTGSNFQAYWLDSHPPSHLHLCLCTFLLHCSKRAQKTKTSSSYWGLHLLSRKKLNLRRKHCDGDCFWRRVDWEANLKPISFFAINAPQLKHRPVEIFRGQCKISR